MRLCARRARCARAREPASHARCGLPPSAPQALERINIFTEARNFLVFQGDVESVASKSTKEMLQYFEVFSGSAEWKCVHASRARARAEAGPRAS